MNELKRIFPECDSDTLLVELILQRGRPRHIHGISNVVIAMANYDDSAYFCVGLVDTDRFKRDKDNENILAFSEEVENKIEKEGLLVKKIPMTNKYLIRIHPAFEKWIWKIANENGIKPNEFEVSSWKEFVSLSKHYKTNPDVRFKKICQCSCSAKSSPDSNFNKVVEQGSFPSESVTICL